MRPMRPPAPRSLNRRSFGCWRCNSAQYQLDGSEGELRLMISPFGPTEKQALLEAPDAGAAVSVVDALRRDREAMAAAAEAGSRFTTFLDLHHQIAGNLLFLRLDAVDNGSHVDGTFGLDLRDPAVAGPATPDR